MGADPRSLRIPLATLVIAVAVAACGASATPTPILTAPPTATPPPVASPQIEEPPAATPEPTAETTIYVVKSGDTMYGIAKKLGITLKALQAENPQVSDPRTMQVGEKLVIPAP